MTQELEQRPISVLSVGRSRRRPELDALRGFFLVWMTLTHLPTRLSEYVNQPLGFVSSAEGFVFLSALLVAHLYFRQEAQGQTRMRNRLWKRSIRIYGYHLLMLLFAFTIAAHVHRLAISNLLDFYLAHPARAIVGSVFLVYCPPLLDILPLYIIFMLLTPSILTVATDRGWRWILTASGAIWLLAQFGLRAWIHSHVLALTGFDIPLEEIGAFNLFAWQLIWILGLWIGSCSASGDLPFAKLPRAAYGVSAAVCLFFIGVRHTWFGLRLGQESFGMQLDKWQIGPLRLLNLVAFACVIYWLRRLVVKVVTVEPFLTLGKASLEVFCAHVVFVFIGLAFLYGDASQLHGVHAMLLIVFTFSGMLLVAIREVNRQDRRRSPRIDPFPTDVSTSG